VQKIAMDGDSSISMLRAEEYCCKAEDGQMKKMGAAFALDSGA
jgi:hypothetical protein